MMAKGLSPLQLTILGLAWDRAGGIFVGEIIPHLWQARGTGDSIDAAGYGSLHSSVSRCLERLRRRGLVRIFKDVTGAPGTLIYLTDQGIEFSMQFRPDE